MDEKQKKALGQLGKSVGLSTGIGTGIGVAGALINRKIKKKKEKTEMDKQALNLVNETFEKVAGMKDVLTGKNVSRAIKDVKGGAAVVNNFKKNLKHIEPSARQATGEAISVMSKDLNKMKGRVVKEGAKTVGTYAGAGATALAGAKALKKKKKEEEKTANDIVNETFEKVAGFNMSEMIPSETLKKMKAMAGKSNDVVDGVKSKTGNRTNFNGTIKNIKDKSPSMEQVKAMTGTKKGVSPKVKTAIGAGASVAALAGGALAHNKLKKKKEEKTASDIVNESFEKMAK